MVFGELGEGKDKKGIYMTEGFKLKKVSTFPINVLMQKLVTSDGAWPYAKLVFLHFRG